MIMKAIKLNILGMATFGLMVTSSMGQVVEKGKVMFDLYYGYAPLNTAGVQALTSGTGSVSSLGPIGGRFQYMVGEKVGLGLDMHYQASSATWEDLDTLGMSTGYMNNYEVDKIRAMVRLSWEFLRKERFSMFWANSIGYRKVNRSWTYGDPERSSYTFKSFVPVATRTAIGARYFFTDNIGVNLEVGLSGGALIQGGISASF